MIKPSAGYYNCLGSFMLGGYGVLGPGSQKDMYFERIYTNLPTHNMIYLSFTAFQLDSLETSDFFDIMLGSKVFSTWGSAWSSWGTPNYCGGPYPDALNIRFFVKASHSQDSLDLRFVSRADEDSLHESYGIRDVRILIATAPSLYSESICALSSIVPSANLCVCQEGEYDTSRNGSGPCQTCHPNCASCFGSTAQECYQCSEGFSFDGTECVACDSSCSICHGGSNDQCDVCPSGKLLFNKKYCTEISTCSFPLTMTSNKCGNKYCSSPCPESDFVYWNLTCANNCNFPLKQVVITLFYQTCQYPCSTEGEYLYPNGSCIGECKAPNVPVREGDRNFCSPLCLPGQHLLYNGSCVDTCNSPLRMMTNLTGEYCFLPCDRGTGYYYAHLEECFDKCDEISRIKNETYNYMVCLPEQHYFGRLLHHLKFLKINEPPARLQNISVTHGNNILSLRVESSMFLGLDAWKSRAPASIIFKDYTFVASNFLVNFCDDMILLSIVFVSIFVLQVFGKIFERIDWIFERMITLIKWNLLIMLFGTNAGNIIFFSILHFREEKSDSLESIFGLFISIIMLASTAILLSHGYILIDEAQREKEKMLKTRNPTKYYKFISKYEKHQVLFRGYQDSSLFQQSFYLVYCLRMTFPMVIAISLENIPLLQVVLYLTVSVAILVYLMKTKPISKRLDHYNLVALEIIRLIAEGAAFFLVVLDSTDNSKAKVFFGDLIISSNTALNILAVTALLIKLLVGGKTAYNLRQIRSMHEKRVWLQLLFLPLQQGCFGFEQFQIVPFKLNNSPLNQQEEDRTTTENIILDENLSNSRGVQTGDTFNNPTNQEIFDIGTQEFLEQFKESSVTVKQKHEQEILITKIEKPKLLVDERKILDSSTKDLTNFFPEMTPCHPIEKSENSFMTQEIISDEKDHFEGVETVSESEIEVKTENETMTVTEKKLGDVQHDEVKSRKEQNFTVNHDEDRIFTGINLKDDANEPNNKDSDLGTKKPVFQQLLQKVVNLNNYEDEDEAIFDYTKKE